MGEKLNVRETKISGVVVVETTPFSDHRGAFARFFCARDLALILGDRNIVQVNHSVTKRTGAVRGMHFQYPPHAEMKLVRCIRGRVFDVALDLRAGSPSFLQWHAEELDPLSAKMMVIPEGCAHGFQVLEEGSEMLYLHTQYYHSESESGVRPTDPTLGIAWPLAVEDLSTRDACHSPLTSSYVGISL